LGLQEFPPERTYPPQQVNIHGHLEGRYGWPYDALQSPPLTFWRTGGLKTKKVDKLPVPKEPKYY
jgi:hypothetical protein